MGGRWLLLQFHPARVLEEIFFHCTATPPLRWTRSFELQIRLRVRCAGCSKGKGSEVSPWEH